MSYIDAHAHLGDKIFNSDRAAVISSAKAAGVLGALVVSEYPGDCQTILDLAEQYPDFCYPCLGVHPVQGDPTGIQRSACQSDLNEVLPFIEKYHEKLIAIGEIGLDFTPRFIKSTDDKEMQRLIFQTQVEAAIKYDLPVNVHSRSAGRPAVALLKEMGAKNVLLHAFDGRASVALDGAKAGFYFSIPPSIVRSEQKDKLVKQLPIENILLETDSPALGPSREERNEPKNIVISCDYIAKVKNMDRDKVAKILLENTLKLFPKLKNYIKL